MENGDTLTWLQHHLDAMPPVAAMGLRIDHRDQDLLRLHAPLSLHVNDKGCAFGGSLVSMMTLAGWGLVAARLREAGIDADLFVADSQVRYQAPLYDDLVAEARLDQGQSWDGFFNTFAERGRARLQVLAQVPLPDGSAMATTATSRYVAIARS